MAKVIIRTKKRRVNDMASCDLPRPLDETAVAYAFDEYMRGERRDPPRCKNCHEIISSNLCLNCGTEHYSSKGGETCPKKAAS